MLDLLKKAKRAYLRSRSEAEKSSLAKAPPDENITTDDFAISLAQPTDFYLRAFQDFHNLVPAEVRAHRKYFSEEMRGFGEDAFHTMWWRLIEKFRPESFLEIGVYRGQVLSLVSLLSKLAKIDCKVTGISPFSPAGDSVSTYLTNMDYLQDTLVNFSHFSLPEPTLVKAYSTDEKAEEVIRSRTWDMIYIDGNHDYEVVVKDWNNCTQALNKGGIVVMDDSGLTTKYRPPRFATGGHPGPSNFASEIDSEKFEEILQVGHNRVFRKL